MQIKTIDLGRERRYKKEEKNAYSLSYFRRKSANTIEKLTTKSHTPTNQTAGSGKASRAKRQEFL